MFRKIMAALMLYSKLPVPGFKWKDEDFNDAIAYLPVVGIVIGLLQLLVFKLSYYANLPMVVKTIIWLLIPLLITGGFHIDGFMDTQDAIKSYKEKAEKLEILKDPHIGAFSVISLVTYGLSYFAALYLVLDKGKNAYIYQIMVVSCLVRFAAVWISLKFKSAKSEGMLNRETKNVSKVSRVIAVIFGILSVICVVYISIPSSVVMLTAMILFILYYKKKMYKEFGGVTGDLIGYFICTSQLLCIIILAVFAIISGLQIA